MANLPPLPPDATFDTTPAPKEPTPSTDVAMSAANPFSNPFVKAALAGVHASPWDAVPETPETPEPTEESTNA